MTNAFNRDYFRAFRVYNAPTVSSRKIFKSAAVFSEIIGGPGLGMTEPLPTDDAYLVSVRLVEGRYARVFFDGKEDKHYGIQRGAVNIHDLRRQTQAEVWDAFHILTAYLPRTFLVAYAEQHDQVFRDFPAARGMRTFDASVESLLRSLQPAIARPQEASALFIDHVATALTTHLFFTYNDSASKRLSSLSRHQLQRGLDLIEDSLGSDISLAELAQACNVSSRHLTRLFMRFMGQPPHRYLLSRRIARAKLLLEHDSLSLSEVAQNCGFADQSHFTRTFTGMTGLSPGAFRREVA